MFSSQRLPSRIYDIAQRFPDKIAVADQNGEVTYSELILRICSFTDQLKKLGVVRGDRVLLLVENSVDFAVAHLAIICSGAISVPCESSISQANLTFLSDVTAPRCAVFSRSLEPLARDTVTGIPLLAVVSSDLNASTCQFSDESALSELMTIMFTTGSTGRPKGVALSQQAVLTTLNALLKKFGYSEKDFEVITLPLCHNFGLGHLYCCLLSGAGVFLANGLSRPKRVFEALKKYRATGFPGTPLGYELLLGRYRPLFIEAAQSLRFIVINSAKLSRKTISDLRRVLSHVKLFYYYGLTEASRSTVACLSDLSEAQWDTVGTPLDHVTLSVVDAQGNSVASNQVGELVIEGPHLFEGYWNGTGPTPSPLDGKRLRTRDLGYRDSDGLYFVVGREDDLLNVGGFKINPNEVESVMAQFDGVTDCALTLLEEADKPPRLVACIVSDSHFDATPFIRFCSERLEPYKCPREVSVVPAIPRSSSGKMQRHQLKESLRSADA